MKEALKIAVFTLSLIGIVAVSYSLGTIMSMRNAKDLMHIISPEQLPTNNSVQGRQRHSLSEFSPNVFQISDSQIVLIDTLNMNRIYSSLQCQNR